MRHLTDILLRIATTIVFVIIPVCTVAFVIGLTLGCMVAGLILHFGR